MEAWIRPQATADHTADEHLVESIRVIAGDIVEGVGFTIHAFDSESRVEPAVLPHSGSTWGFASATTVGAKIAQPGRIADPGGKMLRIHGAWTVAWRWS